eukprot:gene12307-12394_t
MSDILERVRKIVIEHLDADPAKVTDKASFIDDLGADSLDNVELVMAFEEEFDIEIPDDAAEHIQTASGGPAGGRFIRAKLVYRRVARSIMDFGGAPKPFMAYAVEY